MNLRGLEAEETAVRFLRQQGYKILARNFRTRFGELDIIGMHREVLCFIEVKSRSHAEFGAPQEAVDRKKQQKLIKVALYYLQQNYPEQVPACRFDVVSICEHSEPELIANAFQSTW